MVAMDSLLEPHVPVLGNLAAAANSTVYVHTSSSLRLCRPRGNGRKVPLPTQDPKAPPGRFRPPR